MMKHLLWQTYVSSRRLNPIISSIFLKNLLPCLGERIENMKNYLGWSILHFKAAAFTKKKWLNCSIVWEMKLPLEDILLIGSSQPSFLFKLALKVSLLFLLSRLNQDKLGGAWCPKNTIQKGIKEWIQIDLKKAHIITGIVTQVILLSIPIWGQGLESFKLFFAKSQPKKRL